MSYYELIYFIGIPVILLFSILVEEMGFLGTYLVLGVSACIIGYANGPSQKTYSEKIKIVGRVEYADETILFLEDGQTKTVTLIKDFNEVKGADHLFKNYYFRKCSFGPDSTYSTTDIYE